MGRQNPKEKQKQVPWRKLLVGVFPESPLATFFFFFTSRIIFPGETLPTVGLVLPYHINNWLTKCHTDLPIHQSDEGKVKVPSTQMTLACAKFTKTNLYIYFLFPGGNLFNYFPLNLMLPMSLSHITFIVLKSLLILFVESFPFYHVNIYHTYILID